MNTPASRAAELRQRIEGANRLYHELMRRSLPDAQYDALVNELEAFGARAPGTCRCHIANTQSSATPSGRFAPVEHAIPMLVIGKCL